MFKTPGRDIDITVLHVTLELNVSQQNNQLDKIKRSLFSVLQSEVDFWLNEIIIKKILKQKIINQTNMLQPNHNLENDQALTLNAPSSKLSRKSEGLDKLGWAKESLKVLVDNLRWVKEVVIIMGEFGVLNFVNPVWGYIIEDPKKFVQAVFVFGIIYYLLTCNAPYF